MSLAPMVPRSCLAFSLALAACAPTTPPASEAASPTAKPPVTLMYLGVAGWQMDDGAHTLLFDPYFTRVHTHAGTDVVSPDLAVIAKHTPAHADAILVGHSHYDHLLDVPTLAKATGAIVAGTESTLNVARAAGLPDARLVLVEPGKTYDFGPFHVQAIHALHSLTGQPDVAITLPMAADGYTQGGTLQYVVHVEGRTVLFLGTANFIESELTGLRPEVAIAAVGLREKVPDYSCRLMRALGQPPLVYTNHFDAHNEPLGPKQMDIGDDGVKDLAAFADEVHACAPNTKVVVPPYFQPMAI